MRLFGAIVLLGVSVGLNTGCESEPPPRLEEGRWLGTILPIGHPEASSDVYYRVAYTTDGLSLIVGSVGAESRDARDIEVTQDTLRFVFDEAESDVPLNCALGLQENGGYEGLCTDADGNASYFTMKPPDPFGGEEA